MCVTISRHSFWRPPMISRKNRFEGPWHQNWRDSFSSSLQEWYKFERWKKNEFLRARKEEVLMLAAQNIKISHAKKKFGTLEIRKGFFFCLGILPCIFTAPHAWQRQKRKWIFSIILCIFAKWRGKECNQSEKGGKRFFPLFTHKHTSSQHLPRGQKKSLARRSR